MDLNGADAARDQVAARPERAAQDRLLDAICALDVRDNRIRDLLVEVVRADPGRATLFAEYGDDDPVVIGVLAELARDCFHATDRDPEDIDAFDNAAEIVQALLELHAECEEIEQFETISERRSEARRATRRASSAIPSRGTPGPSASPVAVAQRPGRNDFCWCGSDRKYKKCHLDEDDEARRSP